MKSRTTREHQIVSTMIRMYCRREHGFSGGLCTQCQGLSEYAALRLDKCPFGETKPVCNDCVVHCYSSGRREEIRTVMRSIGPIMIWYHPILAIQHLIDKRRKSPSQSSIKLNRRGFNA